MIDIDSEDNLSGTPDLSQANHDNINTEVYENQIDSGVKGIFTLLPANIFEYIRIFTLKTYHSILSINITNTK